MGYKQGSYYTIETNHYAIEFLGTKYRACLPDARMGRDIHLIIHVKFTRFINAFAHHLALSTRYIQFSKNALK
jgi:hypothetical protein